MKVLITGGAGYIGSHAVLAFQEAGHDVVVVDDLSTGRRESVPERVPFILGDAGDRALMRQIMTQYEIEAVVHFAGSIIVPESVTDPLKYYQNNTCVSRDLIAASIDCNIRHFIFSSTAAVYGHPERIPIDESAPTAPLNPYGRSKLMTEWILEDTAAVHDMTYMALRYFNVAGADPEGRVGQSGPNATHLVKIAAQTVVGLRPGIEIYGQDYDTPDGTCVRDYIHVNDLAAAHVDALRGLSEGGPSEVLNCGYGRGYSVKEVLDAVELETGTRLNIRAAPRRAGDSPALVADAAKIRKCLGWQPAYDDLGLIIRTAVDWERKLARDVKVPAQDCAD